MDSTNRRGWLPSASVLNQQPKTVRPWIRWASFASVSNWLEYSFEAGVCWMWQCVNKIKGRKIRSQEMSFRKLWMTGVTVSLAVLTVQAKTPKYAPPVPLTPEQSALIQKAVAQEKVTVKAIQEHTPVGQTYFQNMRVP